MPQRTCSAPGCRKKYYARGYCKNHYQQWLRKAVARCRIPGCGRPGLFHGLCRPHDRTGGRPLRPMRRPGTSTFAWGRLWLDRSTVPILAREAKRRHLAPSGLLSEIIEAWARARAEGVPAGRLQPCSFPGCERPVYGKQGLCRTHYVQRHRGKPLRPLKFKTGEGVAFGRLLLRPELLARAKASAARDGISVAELIRRALERSQR